MSLIKHLVNSIDIYRTRRILNSPEYDKATHHKNITIVNAILGASRYNDAFFLFTEKFREKIVPSGNNIILQETPDLLKEIDELFMELFLTAVKLLFLSGESTEGDYLPYYNDYKPALGVLEDYANGENTDDGMMSEAGRVLVYGVVKFLSSVLEKIDHKTIRTSPIGKYINTDFKKRKADYEERKANVKLF